MATFQIPEPFQAGFEILAELKEDDLKLLLENIRNVPVGIGPNTFQSIVLKGIDIKDGHLLARTLFSLGDLLISFDGDLDELSKSIALSYNESIEEKLAVGKLKQLENNLKVILENCGTLKSTFKALNLLTENDKVYRDGKIITDIRIVFNDDIELVSQNAIVIHQLKIDYQNNSESKELYFSLDSNDLKKLQAQIERAIKKEELIKLNYCTNLTFIDIND